MYMDKLATTAYVTLDMQEPVLLEYFIRTLTMDDEAEQSAYALRVDMQGRSTITPFFTQDYAGIMEMVNAFAEGTVMPCALVEMCDEWQGTYLNTTET